MTNLKLVTQSACSVFFSNVSVCPFTHLFRILKLELEEEKEKKASLEK